VYPGEAKERMKADLGVVDEGSDHEGKFEMRDDDEHGNGEFQMDGEEMLKEIQDLVACMYLPPCSPCCSFLLPVDNGQEPPAMSCSKQPEGLGEGKPRMPTRR
jgi:hypothetical protein